MPIRLLLLSVIAGASLAFAEAPRVLPPGELPSDVRLGDLRTLNSYFPFKQVDDKSDWTARKDQIKRRILISQGLWPEPTKSDLQAVVHGRVEFDDFSVERVYFQSIPGHYVTGSLFRPKGKAGPFPAILCPHGHWKDARFYDAGEASVNESLANGAERFVSAARNPIQARCVQLARMGCIAFLYDMTGNCDSIQIGHRPDQAEHLNTREGWGFFSVQADLRLQNMMGLQTWNSVRSLDFLLGLPDVDSNRIGVTGASGGGTQSMIIAAIDDRITAAMPCVMVSTAMQGGCTCENAPLLRIDQGNIDIAAAIAPRPLGLTAANDWTKELETKGYPALRNLYEMLGKKNRLTAAFNIHFNHNYNHVNRAIMYGFFNQHFQLGFDEPVLERDFEWMSKKQLSVWNDDHPAPEGEKVGDAHEVRLLEMATSDSESQIAQLVPDGSDRLEDFHSVVVAAWETLIGRRINQVGDMTFTETRTTPDDRTRMTLGKLLHVDANEEIPIAVLRAGTRTAKGIVVWIGDGGKASVFRNDKLSTAVSKLVGDGYTVISGDLFGQGEFLVDDQPLDAQRMWYQRKGDNAWERFSGYTYGYNHPVFAKRTHDVLSLVKYAQTIPDSQSIHLIGIGEIAGPIALAARSQAGSLIDRTIVDLKGFRFADITKHDSPMFLPGSVKYLDVSGLLGVCSPHSIAVAGLRDTRLADSVYEAADASDHLQVIDGSEIADAIEQLELPFGAPSPE